MKVRCLLLGLLNFLNLFVCFALLYIPEDIVLTCGMDVQIAKTLLKQASELPSSKCPSSHIDQVYDFFVKNIEVASLLVGRLVNCFHIVWIQKDAQIGVLVHCRSEVRHCLVQQIEKVREDCIEVL